MGIHYQKEGNSTHRLDFVGGRGEDTEVMKYKIPVALLPAMLQKPTPPQGTFFLFVFIKMNPEFPPQLPPSKASNQVLRPGSQAILRALSPSISLSLSAAWS